MKRITTRKIIKLENACGRTVWVYGPDLCETLKAAKIATSKCRDCNSVRSTATAIARATLRTAIDCGYNRLVEVEDAAERTGVKCDIDLYTIKGAGRGRQEDAIDYVISLTEL